MLMAIREQSKEEPDGHKPPSMKVKLVSEDQTTVHADMGASFTSQPLLERPTGSTKALQRVPKPQFTAKEAVVESGERAFEPALGTLSLGKSRRAEGLQTPGAQP
ncbi:hypothetical protein FRC04_002073 [Tulasnella sp. 424]|nr:hypothetical protein FRC04_002073 [Tulasnella sp. 424]